MFDNYGQGLLSSSRELAQAKVSTVGDLKKLESKEMALGKIKLFSVFFAVPSRALNKTTNRQKRNVCGQTN